MRFPYTGRGLSRRTETRGTQVFLAPPGRQSSTPRAYATRGQLPHYSDLRHRAKSSVPAKQIWSKL